MSNQPKKRKWTGGEWRVRIFNDDEDRFRTYQVASKYGQLPDKHDTTVCDVYNGVPPETAEANAQLFAASKKLASVVELLLEELDNGRDNWPAIESKHMLVEDARAALSLALGEGE